MLPLGLSIWPEKRVVSKEDKVTTMETECSFATKTAREELLLVIKSSFKTI